MARRPRAGSRPARLRMTGRAGVRKPARRANPLIVTPGLHARFTVARTAHTISAAGFLCGWATGLHGRRIAWGHIRTRPSWDGGHSGEGNARIPGLVGSA